MGAAIWSKCDLSKMWLCLRSSKFECLHNELEGKKVRTLMFSSTGHDIVSGHGHYIRIYSICAMWEEGFNKLINLFFLLTKHFHCLNLHHSNPPKTQKQCLSLIPPVAQPVNHPSIWIQSPFFFEDIDQEMSRSSPMGTQWC